MKNKLPGICFIGCGRIAAMHAGILRKLYPLIELSFASRDASRSAQYAEKFKGINSFGNYEQALASGTFDIAFITTPTAFHTEIACLAANNGKDIIIEKPVARNLKELKIIEDAVKKYKVRCVVAENYYYKPIIKKIRDVIEKGYIGDLLLIEVNKTNRDKITGWREDMEMMGGGALLEGGVHWLNFLTSLAGSSPTEVIALKPEINYITNIPFEDSILVAIRYENGLIAKLLHSWRIINPLKGISLSKIYGTEGIITFESNGLFFALHGKKKRLKFSNPFDFLGFRAMHRSFIENYINDTPWQPSLDRIKKELTIVEMAYKSLKSKKIESLI